MDRIQEHLDDFHTHLIENGYSPTASKNYRFRASTFLRRCPEALEAGESEAREIVEGYIAELPRNTASTIPAAAVRRWWAFRFRKPLRPVKIVDKDLSDFSGSQWQLRLV